MNAFFAGDFKGDRIESIARGFPIVALRKIEDQQMLLSLGGPDMVPPLEGEF